MTSGSVSIAGLDILDDPLEAKKHIGYLPEQPPLYTDMTVEYLLCGICIFISDKVFKFKSSGHACGIVGPIAMLVYLGLYIPAAVGVLISVPVYIASVKTKRHTVPQLIVGSLIPILMLVIDHVLFRVI